MDYPTNLKYTKEHEWFDIETGLVGITDYAQKELGDIVYAEVKTVGEILKQNEVFGSIEAVKTVSDLYLPVTAKIIELNADLESHPELVNQEPYGKGWIIRIEPQNPEEFATLMDSEAYQNYLASL
ncbi:MAG: glycine cleavage system protein GcvH [Microscillaceae bacterium]|nr:glycine cleavage system protein GcvH [Microscillaceae bacterium]MDW8461647.1 glycine cleavage system protein GcvH [Cytophagales bacterium]